MHKRNCKYVSGTRSYDWSLYATHTHTHRITNMEGGYYPLPVRCCPGQRTTRTKYLYRLSFGGSNGSDCKLWAQMAWACNGITLECQVQIPRTVNPFFGTGYKFNRTVAVEQTIGGSSPRASKFGCPIGGLGWGCWPVKPTYRSQVGVYDIKRKQQRQVTFTAVLEPNVKVPMPKWVLHNWKDKLDTRDDKRDALRLFHMTYHNLFHLLKWWFGGCFIIVLPTLEKMIWPTLLITI